MERAQALRLVGRRGGAMDRRRPARLPAGDPARPPSPARGDRAGGDRRGLAVHPQVRRQGLALRAVGLARRAAPHLLRSDRGAGAQPPLCPAAQPAAGASRRAAGERQGGAGRPPVPVCAHDLPGHRAPRLGADEPLEQLALRAAARVLARAQPGARHRARDHRWRVGDGGDAARRCRGARAGDPPAAPAPRRRADAPPGGDALPLRLQRAGHRGRRQRPALAHRGAERLDQRDQGADVRGARREGTR